VDTDQIFIERMHGSGGFHIHWVYAWVRRILIQYLLSVCRVQADTDPIFIGLYAGFRRLLNQLFICMYSSVRRIPIDIIERMQGSGRLLIQYSLRVSSVSGYYWIFIECMQGSGGY